MTHSVNTLFVYGLLMSGFKNEAALSLHKAAERVQKARIRGMLFDLGSYPAAVYSTEHDGFIDGEILSVQPKLLQDILTMMDRFEGVDPVTLSGPEYTRLLISAETAEQNHDAWCYIYNGNSTGLKVIPSGNYRTYITQSNS